MDFLVRVLAAFDDWTGADREDLWWRTDGEYAPATFFVRCDDAFWWGAADLERLTPENVAVLEQATRDCRAAEPTVGSCYAGLLFCCRVRRMRPQGAMYDHVDKAVWPLLDAAGPPRAVDAGNPRKHPSDR